MSKKNESYLRERRSYSISPSVSVNNSVILNDTERKEKNYYGATIKDMSKDLFAAFDDIIKHINYNLVNHLTPVLRTNMSKGEVDTIIHNFLDQTFQEFTYQFDKGEFKTQKLLVFTDLDQETSEFISKKSKNQLENERMINDEFVKERNKYFELARENLKLKMQIEIEKNIKEYRAKNSRNIEETIASINNTFKSTPDFSTIDKNLDLIQSQYLEMIKQTK